MVFALRPVSGRAKTTPTLQTFGFPGRALVAPYSIGFPAPVLHSTFIRCSGKANRWVVFPRSGSVRGPSKVRPCRPAPSIPGKNKGAGRKPAVRGFKARRSSYPIFPGSKPGIFGGLIMQTQADHENVFYTPEFSNRSTISVRRLAWFLHKPMTKTVDVIIQVLPYMFDSSRVCKTCRDKSKCKYCVFSYPELPPEEQFKIFESL